MSLQHTRPRAEGTNMKTIFKWINIFFSIGLVFIALGVAFIAIPYFGNQALIVRSGSMSPAIDAGSIVVVRPDKKFISPIVSTPTYNKGDVIAFRSENNSKTIITHRIMSVEVGESGIFYKTKGDANDDVDGWLVNEQNVLGKTFFTLPFAGRILAFTKSNIGFPLLIILPAILVILLELRSIYKEIRKQKRVFQLQVPTSANLTSLKVLLPIFMTIFVFESTFAFYGDSGISANNIFTAAEVFPSTTPTPTPTPDLSGIADHIVISEVQIDGGTLSANDNDFIELYNPTNSPISLNGMRLVVRTASSPLNDTVFTFDSTHTIPAHGFFLWGHKSGGATPNNFADTIFADVSSAETIAGNNSIALIVVATSGIVDALSWNPAATSLKEGTEFDPDPGDNESLERKALSTSTAPSMAVTGTDEFKGNGFDLNNNSTDFILRTLSQPQNSTSSAETL